MQNTGESPSKLEFHQPIVLRISKGTSRLISTDSEGISGSPPYLSPVQQNITTTQQAQPAASYSTAAANLVAVLSDDPLPQSTTDFIDTNVAPASAAISNELNKPKKEKARPKAEPIKLKIKTTARALEEAETQRAGRSTRRTTPHHDNLSSPDHSSYDQYRQLTSTQPANDYPHQKTQQPESSEQFLNEPLTNKQSTLDADTHTHSDSERGILPKKRRGKNKPKFEAEPIPEPIVEEPAQKRQRGRRRNEDINTETTEVAAQQPIDEHSSYAPPPVTPEILPEITPKKRMTAAARKQYSLPAENVNEPVAAPEIAEEIKSEEVSSEPTTTRGRGRRGKAKQETTATKVDVMPQEEKTERTTRATRSNLNGNTMQEPEQPIQAPATTRSYGRKRKLPVEEETNSMPSTEEQSTIQANPTESTQQTSRAKRQSPSQINGSTEQTNAFNNNDKVTPTLDEPNATNADNEFEKPSVKLVISKKKGSIFKSRAIDGESGESKKQKRHVYKHKWDAEDDDELEDKSESSKAKNSPQNDDSFGDDFDTTDSATVGGSNATTFSRFSRASRPVTDDDLRIRNVKRAHQMQEIGEFQEMDDDVECILESLKSQNPIAARSLAAIQLASKCMTPAFRMHVRAHGTATKFFGALHDATQNQSLGLCTAAIMFVLIQDNLNMDLDAHSLELMLNLLDSDISRKNNYKESGLTDEQTQRNEQKVLEICREIKNLGKAEHLNLENISIGTLAMETLLTLTSKRAGEWFKDELRKLGGVEHIINTICECCKKISDCVIEWTEPLMQKLRKIERCLRVLENVSDRNEDNQKYILYFRNGEAVETLAKFYKLCVNEIALNPTNDATPAGEPGVVLREALVPTLKVLINLTHTFNRQPLGAVIFGVKPMVIDTSLYLLFQAPQYIPDKCIFELSLLVFLLLIKLSGHVPNRSIIINATALPEPTKPHYKVPAIKALIDYFYRYEEMARFVEQNTDDILNNPEKCDKNKNKSQEDVEETVSKLLQKAGNHMEHTFLASYVCLLIGHLTMDNKEHQLKVRNYLRNNSLVEMIQILEKYYNFMNLTASSEAIQVAHMKETKRIIQFMTDCDQHSNDSDAVATEPKSQASTANRVETSGSMQPMNYSTSASDRWANNSASGTSTGASSSSNNLFYNLYFSGR